MNVHAIIGRGQATPQAIAEGLRDVLQPGDAVAFTWHGSPNDTWEAIYDYVLDNEHEFMMFYEEGTNPPRVFREHEVGVVQKVRNADASATNSIDGSGKLLVLWDNDANIDQFEHVDPKDDVLIFDLANGMVPIDDAAGDPIPEPVEPDLSEDEEEDDLPASFTKEELLNAPAAVVKKYGAKKGTTSTTKGGIIKELFPDEEPEDEVDNPEDGSTEYDELVSIIDELSSLVERMKLLLKKD